MYIIEKIDSFNKIFYKDRTINFRLKDIFSNHWDIFLNNNSNLNIRPVVLKEVNKMISCRTSKLGYSVYECPDCGEIKFSFHTCKSRFCPSCSNKYNKQRSASIFSKLLFNYNVVFTIPDKLRSYFRQDKKRFMKVLSYLLENDIGKEEFKKVKNTMYFKYKEGFYVYAPSYKYKSFVDYDSIFVTFWYQMKKFIFSNVKNVTN